LHILHKNSQIKLYFERPRNIFLAFAFSSMLMKPNHCLWTQSVLLGLIGNADLPACGVVLFAGISISNLQVGNRLHASPVSSNHTCAYEFLNLTKILLFWVECV